MEVITTADSREVLEKIGRSLVEERLVACAQIGGPVESAYRWKGTVETATEWVLTVKTRAGLYPAVEKRIRLLHPYEVPQIIGLPIKTGLRDYLAWIASETSAA